MSVRYGPIIYTLLLVTTPTIVVYAQDMGWLNAVITGLEGLVANILIPTLLVVATALFIWGTFLFIARADSDTARAEGKQKIMWSIVALFVLIAVWGLVALLTEIAGVTPAANVTPPGFTV